MSVVGTVAEIWRYPVKSMHGEQLQSSSISPRGVPGDRGWAVRDESIGEIRGAKKIPKLMMCSARYIEEPTTDSIPDVEITLPSGKTLLTSDSIANERLSEFLDREVTLWPIQPASDSDHYRRVELLDSAEKVMAFLDRQEGDPVPELVGIPDELVQEINEFATPRGTYFDLANLHLLTTSTLRRLSQVNAAVTFDVRRFRPKVLIATSDDEQGFVEFEWSGQQMHIGAVPIDCGAPTIRCGMTAHQQLKLPKEPGVLRTIVQEGQNVGIYADSRGTGEIKVGDAVTIAGTD